MPAPNDARPDLVFVYAVNSGRVALVMDYVHKLVSPATYPCHLCAVTYGPLGEREGWAAGLASLGTRNRFLHRDEFQREYGSRSEKLPAVFLAKEGQLQLLLGKEGIDACKTVDDLIGALRRALHPSGLREGDTQI